MRYFTIVGILSLMLVLPSCGKAHDTDKLAYQELALSMVAEFIFDGDTQPLIIELDAPTYDESGAMLARDARITVGEDSILSGVGFEIVSGEYYIKAGELRVPITDEETVSGIADIISLFCIDRSCYYSSQSCGDHTECELSVYKSGDNSVEVHTGNGDGMPIKIAAKIDGRELVADIKSVHAK